MLLRDQVVNSQNETIFRLDVEVLTFVTEILSVILGSTRESFSTDSFLPILFDWRSRRILVEWTDSTIDMRHDGEYDYETESCTRSGC